MVLVYLGIDISTKYAGWCLLTKEGVCVDIGHLEFDKDEKCLYRKLDQFKPLLVNLCKNNDIEKIFIEAPLNRSNNINVVNLLQRWNGMVCAVIYNIFKKKPVLVGHSTAVKTAGIKVPKGVKGKDRKKYILHCVQEFGIIPESKWALKRTGNPCEFCYDQADSYLVCLAGARSS